METIELIPIEDRHGTAVVAAPIRAAALAKINAIEPALRALNERYRAVAFDLTKPKGLAEAKAARHDLRENGRYAVQRAEKAVKDEVNGLKRDMADEVERLVAIVKPREDEIDSLITAREAEVEAQRVAAAAVEAERMAKHERGIAQIRSYVGMAQGLTAARIALGIAALEAMAFGESWEDFEDRACTARNETLDALRQLHAQVLGREQEAARQEQIRLENERQAELNRIEAKRIADEAAEIRRQAAELQRQRQAQEDARVAELAKQREQNAASESARIAATIQPPAVAESPAPDVRPAGEQTNVPAAPTPVTAAGFASLERWTDEDPDAATKLPRVDLQEEGNPRRSISIVLDMTEAPIPPQPEPATITLGQIKEWAGMPAGLTREFIEARGIKPTVDGRALLFTESQRRELKVALVLWATGLQA